MSEKLGQEGAFPIVAQDGSFNIGMSKRLLMAKDILCAIISNPSLEPKEDQVLVKYAYILTDKLLKQENL